jgi:hypothetical protein
VIPCLAPQFFELIKTGSTLADVSQHLRQLSIRGLFGKFPKDFAPWTVNALRIGKVFVHDALKGVVQLLFNIHPELPVEHAVQA